MLQLAIGEHLEALIITPLLVVTRYSASFRKAAPMLLWRS